MAGSLNSRYGRFRCVFEEENRAFRAANGQEVEIKADCRIYYQGTELKIEDIGEGTEAILTVENTANARVVQVDIVRFRGKHTLNSQFQEGILVFSRRLFPTSLLEPDFPNPLAIQSLSARFPAIRKVNGAGNQDFWTAVGVAYLEHISTPCVPAAELAAFSEQLERGKGLEVGFIDAIHELRRVKEKLGVEWVEDRANDVKFQSQLVAYLKQLTVEYAKNHPNEPIVAKLQYGPEGLETQLFYTNLIDLDAMCLLSKALSIRLVLYSADTQYQRTPLNSASSRLPYIYLLHHFEEYFILYSRAKLIAQGYDLISNRRTGLVDSESAIGVKQALYRDEKGLGRGQRTTTWTDACKASLQRHLDCNKALQRVVLAAINTIKQKQSSALFFNPELCAATKEAIQRFSERISVFQAANLSSSLGTSQLLAASNFPETALSALNLCPLCEKEPAFWRFACGHSACRDCISTNLNLLYQSLPFLVTPRGQPVDQVKCMHVGCFHVLSQEELVSVTSQQEYDRLRREAEEVTMKRYCKNCDSERESISFMSQDACGLCDICVIGRIILHNCTCLCGQPIPPSIQQALAEKKCQCALCGEAKSLLDHFTHSICKDHRQLCRDCLYKSAEIGRCFACHRTFEETEKRTFQVYFEKVCELGCGRLISKAQAVKLSCRCYYCLDCAKEEAKRRLKYQVCLRCDQPTLSPEVLSMFILDFQVQEFAIKTSIRDVNRKATVCPLCLNRIGLRYEFILACGHLFHRVCFQEYLTNYADQVIRAPAQCPVRGCKREIEGNVLNEVMEELSFLKYSEALAEMAFHIRTCLKCGARFEFEEVPGHSCILCPKCHNSFCSVCGDVWVSGHDPKLCRFTEIQHQIQALETQKGLNHRVAQCPGCKTPYQKDEKCQRVVCVHPECRIEWCFECSAPQKPILAHHNQWHRPSCRFYVAAKKAKEQFSPKCPKCRELGRLCDPPPNLKVPRRFSLSEY